MLQQTQVATVLPYYHRFMKAFPSVEALDRASLDAVRSVWSGLGYYRRAENLKRAARLVVSRHGGRLPADYQALLRPAGNRTVYRRGDHEHRLRPALPAAPDGNLQRRLCAPAPPDGTRKGHRPIRRPNGWCPHSRPGDFNQAVMELGATICLPAEPLCSTLPVCPTGATRGRPEPSTYRARQPMRTRADAVAIGVRGIAIADSASPPSRRRACWRGLWELPTPETLPSGDRRRNPPSIRPRWR